jgi:hypothetical protein
MAVLLTNLCSPPADCNTSDVIVKVWPYGLVDMMCVRYYNCRQARLKIDRFCFLKLVRLDPALQNLKGICM